MAEHTSYSHLKGEMVMTPEKAFGKVLREIRNEHSLSQEELGFESGYHRTYISLLERGRKSPSLNTVFQLAAALGVRPSEILRRTEDGVSRVSRRDSGERKKTT
jgi:transcriptional regulator with XRE-family HTH domain